MTILPNFPLTANAAISKHFIQNGILDFQGAIHFVQHLPYGRNTDKRDLRNVLLEGKGSCST